MLVDQFSCKGYFLILDAILEACPLLWAHWFDGEREIALCGSILNPGKNDLNDDWKKHQSATDQIFSLSDAPSFHRIQGHLCYMARVKLYRATKEFGSWQNL